MVGKTHQIAAGVSLIAVAAVEPLPKMSLATLIGVLIATFVGGTFPDIDQPTADIWDKIPLGGIVGRLLTPFAGGHRHLTHSLLGLVLFGWLATLFLGYLHQYILIDMQLVWWGFMIAFASHIIADGFTEEGVPLLFPLPIKFGFPPVSRWRIKTDHWFEHLVVVPVLVLAGAELLFTYRHHFLVFFHSLS